MGRETIQPTRRRAAPAGRNDPARCPKTVPRAWRRRSSPRSPTSLRRATIGTKGCGFEQPLEAGLKALWPARDTRLTFLDATGSPTGVGHGEGANDGFLRRGSADGESLLAVVVVSNEDDCSVQDPHILTPMFALDPNDARDAELLEQGLDTRCHFNPRGLFEPARYVEGFKALHPLAEDTVVFGALVGVPPDAVGRDALAAEASAADPSGAERFFGAILDHPQMRERVDDRGTPDPADDAIVPSCNTERGLAFPPRRIVQVAHGFAQNGLVGSICAQDYTPFFDALVARIERGLRGGLICLPRALARDAEDTVACDVIWELPPAGAATTETPTQCDDAAFPFLLPTRAGDAETSAHGGRRCRLPQLRVQADATGALATAPAVEGDATFDDGWFYDDFTPSTLAGCEASPQRIAFTPGAKPPHGVTVKLSCLDTQPATTKPVDRDELVLTPPPPVQLTCSAGAKSADPSRVGDGCLATSPELGFDPREIRLEVGTSQCGGGVCVVERLDGDAQPCSSNELVRCATPEETADRVYCTCRCDAPEGFAQCACPDGFSCQHVLGLGGDALRGGYCLRAR